MIETVDRAIDVLSDARSSERVAAIRFLCASSDPGTDAVLLRAFEEFGADADRAATVSRILAERDPGRDPSYALEWFAVDRGTFFGRLVGGLLTGSAYLYPHTTRFGVSRLLGAKPFEHYSQLLRSRSAAKRSLAVLALSDVPDDRVVGLVDGALADPNWAVRANGADAVRRLRFTVGLSVISDSELVPRLTSLLSDHHDEVSRRAARALVKLGRGDHRADEIVGGTMEPLPRAWEGEEIDI